MLGRGIDEVSSEGSSKSLESIESQNSNMIEDFVLPPLKTHQKTSKQKVNPAKGSSRLCKSK